MEPWAMLSRLLAAMGGQRAFVRIESAARFRIGSTVSKAELLCSGQAKPAEKLGFEGDGLEAVRSATCSSAVIGAVLFGAAFEGQGDESADEVRIGDAGGGPKLGIHADGGESGQRVDLIQV